ncbi:DUF4438 domain-containing protein [Candidatus Bathyarchaeota archaeon]|nr:DUF4438 domain-containing protein [Candidatus Bathyarchaeota archaeon]
MGVGGRWSRGVSADGIGSDREKMSFRNFCCIGNEARVVSGMGKGAKGTVVGKIGYLPGRSHHVVIHFKDEDLEKLSIGDKIQVKAWGVGLKIRGRRRGEGPQRLPNPRREHGTGGLRLHPHRPRGEGDIRPPGGTGLRREPP